MLEQNQRHFWRAEAAGTSCSVEQSTRVMATFGTGQANFDELK